MTPIRFYNTLTHRAENFAPIDPPQVYMYTCGPTVYDYQHIGNYRSFMFADVLRRFLELVGFRVHQVMNLTDVGHMTEDHLVDGGGQDKMEVGKDRLKEAKQQGKANVDNPDDPYQVAAFFIDAFVEDARQLGLKVVDEYPSKMPRATDHVPQMQAIVKDLLETEHAYVAADGTVYYSIETFPDYGRLSGNTLAKLRGGAGGRVLDEHQAQKRHPGDFLLWKPDATHLMKWPSPWGEGYPGWHIECSAMATHVLGQDQIDIHTGGEDNIFPHHECEIAQTRGATGNDHFARFWMHARHLRVDGEKMSKSKGTFYTLRDLLERGIDPAVIRYELLKGTYRANLNFTFKGLEESASAVSRLRDRAVMCQEKAGGASAEVDLSHRMVDAFASALANDLNMSAALGALFTWLSQTDDEPAVALAALQKVDSVLGILSAVEAKSSDVDESLCQGIDQARAAKDYARADELRDTLISAGYEVLQTKDGTKARKKLA